MLSLVHRVQTKIFSRGLLALTPLPDQWWTLGTPTQLDHQGRCARGWADRIVVEIQESDADEQSDGEDLSMLIGGAISEEEYPESDFDDWASSLLPISQLCFNDELIADDSGDCSAYSVSGGS